MKKGAYYNEHDKFAAQWLRNLIKAGHIAPGDVDERSIVDVRADDIRGYVQCHWFAGLGGWSRALRLAGWEDDRPVWTASVPCQPYSAASNGHEGPQGADDERDLWPTTFPLIRESRPPAIFGEQVRNAVGWGWWDRTALDLEGEAYACAALVLRSDSVGGVDERERLYWVADTNSTGLTRSSTGGGIQVAGSQKIAVDDDPLAIARRALGAGDFGLLPRHGIPMPVARRVLHGFGNAVNAHVAASFIRAYMGI